MSEIELIRSGEIIDLSSPRDITCDLVEELEKIYNENNLRLFAVNLEYLLVNNLKLAKENQKNHFVTFGKFKYYSPSNLEYDFTCEKWYIDISENMGPAMILDTKNQRVPLYLDENLLRDFPELAYKCYSELTPKSLEPSHILSPTFCINLDLETNILIPLILKGVEDVFPLEGNKIHYKIPFS